MALDISYFANKQPWAGIETVIVDGQSMVKIPKFYCRRYTPASGSYAGKSCWEVSDKPAPGFHVHPAFMRNGSEIDYFYRASYEAYNAGGGKAGSIAGVQPWVSITNPDAISACAARNTGTGEQAGWHLQTIYEVAACQILMLLELGTPDVQTKIGTGNVSSSGAVASGTSNAKWRGICEAWGNVLEHVDGCKGSGTTIQVFDNKGNGTYVNTGLTMPSSGYIKEVYDNTGTNFDLGDLFLPSSVSSSSYDGSFGDYSYGIVSNFISLYGGNWGYGAGAGAFCWYFSFTAKDAYASVGFRLAKYPN